MWFQKEKSKQVILLPFFLIPLNSLSSSWVKKEKVSKENRKNKIEMV
jgi:hypothetical protein